MTKIFARGFGAAMLRRQAFREAFFDNDAAADGAILVSIVAAVGYLGTLLYRNVLGSFSLIVLLQIVVAAVASWLILAFATWGAATWLFGSSARPQIMIGVQGLAPLPLLLEIPRSQLVGSIGLVWYLAILVMATQEVSSLDWKKSGVSVLIGFAAALLIRAIMGVPFAAFNSLLN